MNQTSNSLSGSRVNYAGASPPPAATGLRVVDAEFLNDAMGDRPEIDWVTVREFLTEMAPEVREDAVGRARFGKFANDAADGYGMVFTPAYDDYLGTVRQFPRMLLVKVYKERRTTLKWPALLRQPVIEESPAVREEPSAELRALTMDQLRAVGECAQDPKMRDAALRVLRYFETHPEGLEASAPDAPGVTAGQVRQP